MSRPRRGICSILGSIQALFCQRREGSALCSCCIRKYREEDAKREALAVVNFCVRKNAVSCEEQHCVAGTREMVSGSDANTTIGATLCAGQGWDPFRLLASSRRRASGKYLQSLQMTVLE